MRLDDIGNADFLLEVIERAPCCVCVLDKNTTEILTLNGRMRAQFGLQDAPAYEGLVLARSEDKIAARLRPLLKPDSASGQPYEAVDAQGNTAYRITAHTLSGQGGRALLVYYLEGSSKIKDLEYELARKTERENILSDIAGWFLSDMDLQDTVNRTMQRLGEYLRADWVLITQFGNNFTRLDIRYEWRKNKEHGGRDLTGFDAPPGFADLVRGDPNFSLSIEDVLETEDYKGYMEQDIRSFVNMPILIDGELWGILEFNQSVVREWKQDEIDLGIYLSRTLSNFIGYKLMAPRLLHTNRIIQTIVDIAPAAIFWTDTRSVFVGCNDLFAKMANQNAADIIGTDGSSFMSQTHMEQSQFYNQFVQTPQSGGRISYDMQTVDSDGNTQTLYVKKAAICDENGRPILIAGVYEVDSEAAHPGMDVREKFQVGLAKNVRDVTYNHIFYVDRQSHYLGAYSDDIVFAGMGDHELKNTSAADFLSGKKLEQYLKTLQGAVETRKEVTGMEYSIVGKGGRVYYYLFDILPIFGPDGELMHLRVAFKDITSKRNSEQQLRRMLSIVENVPLYVAIIDKDGQYRFMNPGVMELTGCSHQELMRDGISSFFLEEEMPYIVGELIPEIFAKKRLHVELKYRNKHTGIRIMHFTAFVTEGAPDELAAIGVDVTEQKQLEQDLLAAKEEAEKASQAKGEFLSRMSHEIRTPLNAIVGLTDIGKMSDALDKKQYCFDQITSASNHLLGIINDILDLSKIEANKLEISEHEFDFENMLMSVANVINFRTEEKNQTFLINIDKSIPTHIIADEMRLSQVLTNLLSNAVKFTPEKGLVMLNVSCSGQEGLLYTLLFEVCDNGIGISDEDQKRLFRSFEQADGGIARRFGGTGLGLAISKNLIELMDGKIWVDSKAGEGAKFAFRLKVERGRMSPQPQLHPQIDRENMRVLVADDSKDVRAYFLRLMDTMKISCDVAEDGFQAIEMYADSLNSHPYDIIFLDWQMPKMDGIEVGKRIKQISTDNILIMISAASREDLEDQALRAGIDRTLTKPLFPSMLINVINESLGLTAMTQEKKEESHSAHFSGKRLLLAEDVPINQEIVKAYLEDTGIVIDCAQNGVEALHLYRSHPDQYDAILMDIHMPDMDGYDATQRIRQLGFATAKTVPIIAMTANVFKEDVERCLAAGMNDHIGKPVKLTDLIEKLSTYLHAHTSGPRPAAAKNSGLESPVAGDRGRYVNLAEGLELAAGSKSTYLKLLQDFDCRQDLEELCRLLDEDNLQAAARAAHKIKGVAAHMAFPELHRVASEIERLALDGKSVESWLEPLKRAYENVLAAREHLLDTEGMQ